MTLRLGREMVLRLVMHLFVETHLLIEIETEPLVEPQQLFL